MLVLAFDADEARATAHDAHPGLLPPDAAVLAADATAQAVLNGEPVANLPVIR